MWEERVPNLDSGARLLEDLEAPTEGMGSGVTTLEGMATDVWPTVPEDQGWVLDEIEEMLAETTDTTQQLTDRARELRAKAKATDIEGFREAWLALADRYEEAGLRVARPRA
jgi:hypothetical protein